MIKRAIEGWNAAPGAPENWDPARDGDCGALPIRVSRANDGTIRHCDSAWEPTPQELEMLNVGGSVILRVAGWQCPVALWAEPPKTG